MKTEGDGRNAPLIYSTDEAAKRLGIIVEELRRLASRLNIQERRVYGRKGRWFAVCDMEKFADALGVRERSWDNPWRWLCTPLSM